MSRRMLEGSGINRIYLVTHAWHMARARYAFYKKRGYDINVNAIEAERRKES